MSLRDAACYTLTLIPSLKDPTVVELVENYNGPAEGDRRQIARFARVREDREGEVYSAAIYDYSSGAKLASMGMEIEKAKKRRLQLHGPEEEVAFDFTGMINFEWTFVFENNKYRWTRSFGGDYTCALDRKPDPKVDVCLNLRRAREADKSNPARLQFLHYNIDRFPNEVKDLRGLETLLAATFVGFLDDMDNSRRPSPSPRLSVVASPPPLPPKPEKVISEEDFEPENPNEILVGMTGKIDDHVSRAVWLLEDPHVLFVVIRTRASEATQRALEVSLGVTRFRHREGLDELKQYVIEEEPLKPSLSHPASSNTLGKGAPSVIKLDEPSFPPSEPNKLTRKSPNLKSSKSTEWSAPNIAIYMSKIDLPDLKPGRRETLKARKPPASSPTLHPNLPPPPSHLSPPSPQLPSRHSDPVINGQSTGIPNSISKESGFSKLLKVVSGHS